MANRKGKCQNPDCECYDQVFEIELGADFKCPACKMELTRVDGDDKNGGDNNKEKSWWKKNQGKVFAGVGVAAILGGVGYGVKEFVVRPVTYDTIVPVTYDTIVVDKFRTRDGVQDTLRLTIARENGVNIDTIDKKILYGKQLSPTEPESRIVFSGTATYDADLQEIRFNKPYRLDLHTNDGDVLYISAGDKITVAKVRGGYLLQGNYKKANGDERFLTGLNNKL